MKYDPQKHHRRSIRLQGYDYSQAGAYYVTIVVHGRECLFGNVVNGVMRLNQFGQIVYRAWFDLPNHYPHVVLGAFCIMPNHAHAIIVLIDGRRGGSITNDENLQTISISKNAPIANDPETHPYVPTNDVPLQTISISKNAPIANNPETRPYVRHPLSEIVRAFKSFSAKRINALRKTQGIPVWQRNYYEHIIRNDDEYNRIHLYIESNPAHWMEDDENPEKKP